MTKGKSVEKDVAELNRTADDFVDAKRKGDEGRATADLKHRDDIIKRDPAAFKEGQREFENSAEGIPGAKDDDFGG